MRILPWLLLLLIPVLAHAIDAPHDYATHDVSCSDCHTAQAAAGAQYYNNMCLNCHRPGHPLGGTKPFIMADQAQDAAGWRTSHAFTGPDIVPEAGAEAPLDPRLNKQLPDEFAPITGTLSCVRCHNQHDNSYPPMLRMPNDQDQLCRDCHRSRDTVSHLTGSHPIMIDYNASAQAQAGSYQPIPLNLNPANPSSRLVLKDNRVVCTSCHGVHHTDSKSSSFDSFSTVQVAQNPYLLRSDLYARERTGNNLCSSCHVKANHTSSKKGQNVQCGDCHGAHVAYPGATAGDLERVPNIYLVRRFITYSGSKGGAKKVLFQGERGTLNYVDSSGTGICQACHAIPAPGTAMSGGGSYPAEHASQDAAVCQKCHRHNTNTIDNGSFSGGCSSCHGYPPRSNVSGGPDGYAVYSSPLGRKNYLAVSGVDESQTPHLRHAGGGSNYSIGCEQCHRGNRHMDGGFQDVFNAPEGTLAARFASAPAYDSSTRQCSASYCHSNGAPRNAALAAVPTYKMAAWQSSAPADCSFCHSAFPGTNAHGRHIAKGIICADCHAATVNSSNKIIAPGRHVDGVKDVSFNQGVGAVTADAVWTANSASCTTRCHSDQPQKKPVWTDASTGSCGSCHAMPPISNAHAAHLQAEYGPKLVNCNDCHLYSGELAATHANGSIDVITNACSTCHPGTAQWSGGRVTCESCHTASPSRIGLATASFKKYMPTSGHGRFTISADCASCHDSGSAHIDGAPGTTRRLPAGKDTGADGSGNNLLCAGCHKTAGPARGMATHGIVKGEATPTMTCARCHDPHGSKNLYMLRESLTYAPGQVQDGITFTNLSTGFVNRTNNRGLCQVCHTATTYYRRDVPEFSHPTRDCLKCHSHNGTFAFQAVAGCDGCHGYPPAPRNPLISFGRFSAWTSARFEEYTGGGGAHLVPAHVSPLARPGEGWANCTMCHNNGSSGTAARHKMVLPVKEHRSNVYLGLDQQLRLAPGMTALYSSARQAAPDGATGSCSNIRCHFKGSKRWSWQR